MRNLILTLIFLTSSLYSSNIDIEIKIINKISTALTNKELIFVHTDSKEHLNLIFKSKKLRYASTCEEANLIITNNKEFKKCKDKTLIFTTDYLSYKSLPDAVGALFYQKGRPTIVFRKTILDKYKISLPEEFKKFIN